MPLVQELHGLCAPPSMELVQRFCTARESLAKHYIEQEKTNLAADQYQDTLALLKPYFKMFDRESKKKEINENKFYQLVQFYYFKQAINLGLMYLQNGRLDAVLEVFGDALNLLKLNIDEFNENDMTVIDELPLQVAKIRE